MTKKKTSCYNYCFPLWLIKTCEQTPKSGNLNYALVPRFACDQGNMIYQLLVNQNQTLSKNIAIIAIFKMTLFH
jgi:hypothetical protein